MTGFGTQYLNYGNPQFTVPTISSFVAWVKGSHSLKFGGDWTQSAIADINLNSFTAGEYNFKAVETGLPNFSQTGWGYASYLIGQVDNGLISSPETLRHQGRGWESHAEDQWRASSKLTVNFGLRWDASQGPWEHNNSVARLTLPWQTQRLGVFPGRSHFGARVRVMMDATTS